MEHLLDFQVTKVYEAKKGDGSLVEGKGDYGSWKLYTFSTDKTDDKKFAFMWDEKKPLPKEGLQIKHMEYEVKIEGKYTNYNAKKLELPEGTKPTAISNANENMGPIPKATNGREISFYVAYAKDIAVALINTQTLHFDKTTMNIILDEVVVWVAKAGKIMMNEALSNGEIPPKEGVKGSSVDDQYVEQQEPPPAPEEDTKDYSGRIDCPTITDDEGNPKNILKIACKTCDHREGCPAL